MLQHAIGSYRVDTRVANRQCGAVGDDQREIGVPGAALSAHHDRSFDAERSLSERDRVFAGAASDIEHMRSPRVGEQRCDPSLALGEERLGAERVETAQQPAGLGRGIDG